MDEQDVLMSDYESMYEESLNTLTEIRDLFTSILLAIVFLVVFGILIPIISGISPTFLLGVAVVVFLASEVGFFLAAEFVLPDDPIWCGIDFITDRDRRIGFSEIIGVVLFVGLVIFSITQLFFQFPFSTNPLPIYAYIGLPLTPLAIPGLVTWFEERKTKKKDESFPSFIRSLGALASAKKTTTAEVLDDLKEKEFSGLTQDIEKLYKRLRTRVDRKLAWDTFSAETGSFLIWKFSDMYYEGIDNGGEPKEISEIISQNFKRVLRVREKRSAKAGSVLGLLYGMTAAVMTAIFLGFNLATRMIDVVGSAMTDRLSEIFSLGVYDIPGTHYLLLLMIVLNALIGSLFIRSVNSGHELNALAHLGILLWIGLLVSTFAEVGLDLFLSI